jgi:hypothetical protein
MLRPNICSESARGSHVIDFSDQEAIVTGAGRGLGRLYASTSPGAVRRSS